MRSTVLLGLAGIAMSASALSVEEAYRLIPHQRTVFQASSATMSAQTQDYLAKLFNVVDQAIIAKVNSRRGTSVTQAYAPVWSAWQELNPPTELKATQEKIKGAILDQQAFLVELENSQTTWNMSHPKVRSAGAGLQAAYADLMRIYPRENLTNQKAFFDYLCALDFV